ncbi:hypothetical protein AB1Y20_018923 [Prymnesium parvum]|uniref:tRNA/rRNA methyltransferase SpoU type domain-containing protein n=1 Tax=Prymnesium parvum TaxID=97485 RepID=A0AB34JSQ4_PRYPA
MALPAALLTLMATASSAAPLLGHIRVVCVGPSQPGNVGMIARACANFDCAQLALVAPEYERSSAEAASYERRFAVQEAGLRVLRQATVTASLGDALRGCALAVGFTRRRGLERSASAAHVSLRELARLRRELDPEARVAFVFGREASGLSSSEIGLCTHTCEILTAAEQGSLSLPAAVVLALGRTFEEELLREEGGRGGGEARGAPRALGGDVTSRTAATLRDGAVRPAARAQVAKMQPATIDDLEHVLKRWARLAGRRENADMPKEWVRTSRGNRPKHGVDRSISILRRLFQRARPTSRELRTMHHMLQQIEKPEPRNTRGRH